MTSPKVVTIEESEELEMVQTPANQTPTQEPTTEIGRFTRLLNEEIEILNTNLAMKARMVFEESEKLENDIKTAQEVMESLHAEYEENMKAGCEDATGADVLKAQTRIKEVLEMIKMQHKNIERMTNEHDKFVKKLKSMPKSKDINGHQAVELNAAMTVQVNLVATGRAIVELSKHVAEVVKNWVVNTGKAINQWAHDTKDSIVTGVKSAWQKVKDAFNATIHSINTFASKIADGVKNTIDGTAKLVGKAVIGLSHVALNVAYGARNVAGEFEKVGMKVVNKAEERRGIKM